MYMDKQEHRPIVTSEDLLKMWKIVRQKNYYHALSWYLCCTYLQTLLMVKYAYYNKNIVT